MASSAGHLHDTASQEQQHLTFGSRSHSRRASLERLLDLDGSAPHSHLPPRPPPGPHPHLHSIAEVVERAVAAAEEGASSSTGAGGKAPSVS